VLVNRGWVYSPDASTVDLGKWDEPPTTTVQGYVEEFSSRGRGPAQATADPRSWRWLDGARLASAFPYPIEPYYVVALAEGQRRPDQTARLELPAMDDGPHKNYAIQWFSFAAIAVVGVGTLIWNERGARASGASA
jgi:cytochrome oxidase assembly protein ShyY1